MQSLMQPSSLLVESPLSPCFHVNSPTYFGYTGPSSGIYNDAVLQCYTAREGCTSKIQYSIAIYVNHYIYLTMALCCQNKSVNLRESMDYVVIRLRILEAVLNTLQFIYISDQIMQQVAQI
jgi:hypothetical protein